MVEKSIEWINNDGKITGKEIKQLKKLSKLPEDKLKEAIPNEQLKSLKNILEKEKKAYIDRVNHKYKYKSEKEKEKALKYVPWMIDTVLNKINNIWENIDSTNKTTTQQPLIKNNTEEKHKKETIEKINSSELFTYFDIPKDKWEELENKLNKYGLNLNIWKFLNWYKEYIENNLQWLKPEYKEKIKQSIWMKVLKLSTIIDERINFVDKQIEEWNYKKEDRKKEIQNQRWIINSKLQEDFSFVNNELLPSTMMLIKYKNKKTSMREETLYNLSDKIEETKKMLESNLLLDWTFDKTIWDAGWKPWEAGTNTWDIFDTSMTNATLTNKWIDWDLFKQKHITLPKWTSILNEQDEKIEAEAIKWYMIAVASQIAIEVWPAVAASVLPWVGTAFWALAWAVAWWTIDLADAFSDEEVLLKLVQKAWLVNPNYRMNKTWIDNILAGIWILPWATEAIKWAKVAKYLSKLPSEEVSSWIEKIQEIMISQATWKKVVKNWNEVINMKGQEKVYTKWSKVNEAIKNEQLKWLKPDLLELSTNEQVKFINKRLQELTLKIKKIPKAERHLIKKEIILLQNIHSNLTNWKDIFVWLNKEQIKFFNENYLWKIDIDEVKIKWDKAVNNPEYRKLDKKGEVSNFNEIIKNFDNLSKSEHTQKILSKHPNLKPIDGIEIDWQKILFSPIIKWWERDEVVWFAEVDWKLEARLFYKSNSDGWWRATPGQRIDGAYSKWKEWVKNYSYVTTTKLDNRLEDKLNNIKQNIQIKEDNLLESFRIIDEDWIIHPINSKKFKKEVKAFNDKWKLNVFIEKWKPWYWDKQFEWYEVNQIKNYIKSLDNKYPDWFIPDFSKWPIKTYESHHTIAWPINVDIFEWTLNWKKVEWHMARSVNNPNQIWISNIRPKDSKITSFWTDSEFINSWILTSKPFEYTDQLPKSFNWRQEIKKYYYDITDVLWELKPIREYKKYLATSNLKQAA